MEGLESLKRPRDETDVIVHEALKEELKKKEAKKRSKSGKPAKEKGVTLEELEAQEGGPVKESLVAMAHHKRAHRRKGDAPVDDTDLVDDIEQAEEDYEGERLGAPPATRGGPRQTGGNGDKSGLGDEEDPGGTHGFTAFNLREERQGGHFDEQGNYVEATGDEGDKDAWLDADGGKVISEEVLAKIEQRRKAEEEQDAAAPLSGRQIAELKTKIAALMQPRETVPRLLKRLGGNRPKPGPRPKKPQQQQGGSTTAEAANAVDKLQQQQRRDQIDMVTEAASALMMAGETDIYEMSKEELDRAAALFRPPPSIAAIGGGEEDEADDMFADESDDEAGGKAGAAGAAPTGDWKESHGAATASGGATAPAAAAAAVTQAVPPGVGDAGPAAEAARAGGKPSRKQQQQEVDYGSWPVKELRRFLQERGKDAAGVVEKADLVEAVRKAAAQGPEGEIPEGYVPDPNGSGYYYSTSTGLYYDAGSGAYYNGGEGRWYTWDGAKGEYVPHAG